VAWHNGDSYDYTASLSEPSRHAFGHILYLDPGDYQVIVRYVYDIRVDGDLRQDSAPFGKFKFDAQLVSDDQAVQLIDRLSTAPDVVSSRLASEWAGVVLRNLGDDWLSCQLDKAAGLSGVTVVQDHVGLYVSRQFRVTDLDRRS
jgi:hypothetical protein